MKIYIAGRMTGIPDLNRKAFADAADKLRMEGHEVFNPAAANLEGMKLGRIMSHVLTWICEEADAIALLPEWRQSGGARVEFLLAIYLGLRVIYL